jgi:hypothetical protein
MGKRFRDFQKTPVGVTRELAHTKLAHYQFVVSFGLITSLWQVLAIAEQTSRKKCFVCHSERREESLWL